MRDFDYCQLKIRVKIKVQFVTFMKLFDYGITCRIVWAESCFKTHKTVRKRLLNVKELLKTRILEVFFVHKLKINGRGNYRVSREFWGNNRAIGNPEHASTEIVFYDVYLKLEPNVQKVNEVKINLLSLNRATQLHPSRCWPSSQQTSPDQLMSTRSSPFVISDVVAWAGNDKSDNALSWVN